MSRLLGVDQLELFQPHAAHLWSRYFEVGIGPDAHHQYPDGAVLFLGTMFAPVEDRDAPGQGFTHHVGDMVTIASEKLGALVNPVTTCDRAPPWRFGTAR